MNNPPAFPIPRHTRHFDNSQEAYMQDDGMTLRDYFAAKAMQGLYSDPDWRQDMSPSDTAFAAYRQADEMLKAREA